MKRWLQRGALFALLLLVFGIIISLYAGNRLIAPSPRLVGDSPKEILAENILIQSQSGSTIHAWLHSSKDPVGSILLLHGIHADRRSMVKRAKFLVLNSYNVLLIDFQAHGESTGNHITMGHLESMDVVSSVNFLQTRFPKQSVGVLGSSLGGASIVLAKFTKPPNAMVLEQVFADVETAVNNRLTLRFGSFGSTLSPLLTYQIQPLLGVSIRRISPIEHIRKIQAPTLLIYGSADKRATPAEGKSLFSLSPEPKEFWLIDGAGHVDLHQYVGNEYEQRILSFFSKHLVQKTE